MAYDSRDTIVAISTPAHVGGATGIVRVGGPRAVDLVQQCFAESAGCPLTQTSKAHRVSGSLQLAWNDHQLDVPCALYLWPDERSYTRQPLAELHLPGGWPLLEAAVERLLACGARLASAGEFTLRAFLAGRIDLTQAEAVLGLVDASDRTSLDAALAQMAGGLSGPLTQLRSQLLHALAELEAGLDFADEDIEFIGRDAMRSQLTSAEQIVATALEQLQTRQQDTPALSVVLVGPPNAGKSSLFNTLVSRLSERFGEWAAGNHTPSTTALVSPVSGTTRDYVTANIKVAAHLVTLIDTAGMDTTGLESPAALGDIDQAPQSIDHASQQTSARQQQTASIVLACESLEQRESQAAEALPRVALPAEALQVFTKSDLCEATSYASRGLEALACSSVTGEGIDSLADAIAQRVDAMNAQASAASLAHTAMRCTASLQAAALSLAAARGLIAVGGEELIAAEIRAALDAIGQVVGEVYTEEVLDQIFSQFCIGK